MSHQPETRKWTRKVLAAIAEGWLSQETVIVACMKYLSEDDVREMCEMNNWFEDEDDEDDEEDEEEDDDE